MVTKTFCSVLWNHQMIDGTGRVKPCCRFLEDFRPKNHTLDNYKIEEIFNSDFQNSLRERVLAGERLEGCRRCYEEEDNNTIILTVVHISYHKQIFDDSLFFFLLFSSSFFLVVPCGCATRTRK